MHEVFQLREQVLTLVRLDQPRPAHTPSRTSRRLFVVVIGAGSRNFGLAVDSLMGEEELVIKALEDRLVTSPLVSGASILGDGTVVLILNVPAVVSHLSRIPAAGSHRMSEKIRVLVVDDSALMRKLIPQALLQRDPSIEVVGTAMDGSIGPRKIEELHPHVVTLDLEMPRMDGIEMLRQITRKHHVPVIVVSAHTEEGASLTLKALALGAFDFVTKPQDAASGRIEQIAAELALKIKVAAASGAPKMIITRAASIAEGRRASSTQPRWPSRVVAIGISTGGPNALQYLFSQLPEDFPGCLLVVQHMPEGFTEMFARRLNESSAIEVKEAQSGDLLLAGRALICPGNRHMKVRRMEHGDIASSWISRASTGIALPSTFSFTPSPRSSAARPLPC